MEVSIETSMTYMDELNWFKLIYGQTKGQLISKCPYEKSVLSKIPTKKISEIFALASKERSNQKNKGTLLY